VKFRLAGLVARLEKQEISRSRWYINCWHSPYTNAG